VFPTWLHRDFLNVFRELGAHMSLVKFNIPPNIVHPVLDKCSNFGRSSLDRRGNCEMK
jgi:hypothetical protein